MTHPLPELRPEDIRQWTTEPYYRRGLVYYQEDRVVSPHREGDMLKAQCEGSRPSPYRVEVTLDDEGIAFAWCSCPLASPGCKHVVAVLLTWVHDPDSFTARDTLKDRLSRRSKGELVRLVEQMIERDPDLERLVDLTETTGQAHDEEWVRSQIRQIIPGAYGPDSFYNMGANLHLLENRGHGYIEEGKWAEAATLFRAVAEELLDLCDEHPYILDGDVGVLLTVQEAVEQIEVCLPHLRDPEQRRDCIRTLFTVYRWDTEYGGLGLSNRVPEILVRQASEDERSLAAGWTRKALAETKEGDWSSTWREKSYGHLLLELAGDELDDESFLQICQETKRWNDLTERLLQMDDVERAVDITGELSDYELLEAARLFDAYGHSDAIYEAVKDRTAEGGDARLLAWLKSYAASRDHLEEAITYSHRLFKRSGRTFDAEQYEDMHMFGGKLGTWASLRKKLIEGLKADGNWSVLTELYLHEGALDEALQAFENVSAGGNPFYIGHSLLREVAEAAEDVYPEKALGMHVQWAEHLIDQRGRDNYRAAAAHLADVKDRYRTMDQEALFDRSTGGLRSKYRRLPAMQDEFDKAGL